MTQLDKAGITNVLDHEAIIVWAKYAEIMQHIQSKHKKPYKNAIK